MIDMIRGQLIFAEGLGPHCAAFGAQLLITYFLASHFDVPIPVHRTPSTLQARMRAPLPLLQRPVVRLQLSVASVAANQRRRYFPLVIRLRCCLLTLMDTQDTDTSCLCSPDGISPICGSLLRRYAVHPCLSVAAKECVLAGAVSW